MASSVTVTVLGWFATVCFALLLTPQVALNHMRKSTEGLSLLLILLWHAAGLLMFPYLVYYKEPFALQLQWALFTVASIVIELQFTLFRRGPPATRWLLAALGLTYTAVSVGTIVGLVFVFRRVEGTGASWLIFVLGSVLSSVCLALGFFPQIYEICKNKSSEGFSLGLSMLDMSGSTLSVAVLILTAAGGRVDVGAIVPYAIIIAFQVVVITLATLVYPARGGGNSVQQRLELLKQRAVGQGSAGAAAASKGASSSMVGAGGILRGGPPEQVDLEASRPVDDDLPTGNIGSTWLDSQVEVKGHL